MTELATPEQIDSLTAAVIHHTALHGQSRIPYEDMTQYLWFGREALTLPSVLIERVGSIGDSRADYYPSTQFYETNQDSSGLIVKIMFAKSGNVSEPQDRISYLVEDTPGGRRLDRYLEGEPDEMLEIDSAHRKAKTSETLHDYLEEFPVTEDEEPTPGSMLHALTYIVRDVIEDTEHVIQAQKDSAELAKRIGLTEVSVEEADVLLNLVRDWSTRAKR